MPARFGHRPHRRGAIREIANEGCDGGPDAQHGKDLGEVDAGGGLRGIGKVDRVGAEDRFAKRLFAADFRNRRPGAHRDRRGDRAEVRHRRRFDEALARDRLDLGAREDQHVARFARRGTCRASRPPRRTIPRRPRFRARRERR
jgi:hypothetical protein